jgi:hypothetical protein
MLIGVPATINYPLGMRGLGDCSAFPGTDYESAGVCYDDSGNVLGYDPDYTSPVLMTGPTPTQGELNNVPTANCPGGVDLFTGQCVATGAVWTPTVTSYPSGNSSAQNAALLAAITQAGDKVLSSQETPYLIPGTNSIYNPATGAISTGAATPGALAAASALSTSALTSSLMPIAMIGIVAVVLVMMMGKK